MKQRVGETDADFKKRRQDYDAARPGRGSSFRVSSRTVGGDGGVRSVHEVARGRRPSKAAKIEHGILTRTSTLFDKEGRVAAQWVIETPKDRQRLAAWQAVAKEFASELPKVAPSPPPIISHTNLLVEYPVGDHHMGMLAWKRDAGASWDLDIGESVLVKAFTHLTSVTPPAPKAVIEFLGDFFHYDSPTPVTPTGKNTLDADGRFPKMVRAGVRSMRRAIEIVMAHHAQVHVIVEIGNHDLYSAVFLMECLANVYENEPRVTIDTSPKHFHYFRHGRCLVGTHHGHGPKPEQLPGIMAADRPADWGDTDYRFWRTGHVHSKRQWDFPGCSVESFRILPPEDSWAYNKGYRSHRSMEAIVLHDTFGEAARYPVTPRMLEQM